MVVLSFRVSLPGLAKLNGPRSHAQQAVQGCLNRKCIPFGGVHRDQFMARQDGFLSPTVTGRTWQETPPVLGHLGLLSAHVSMVRPGADTSHAPKPPPH
jgi:hypothetical protein